MLNTDPGSTLVEGGACFKFAVAIVAAADRAFCSTTGSNLARDSGASVDESSGKSSSGGKTVGRVIVGSSEEGTSHAMFGVTVMNSLLELVTSGSCNGVSVGAETLGAAGDPDGQIGVSIEGGRAGEGRSGQLLP